MTYSGAAPPPTTMGKKEQLVAWRAAAATLGGALSPHTLHAACPLVIAGTWWLAIDDVPLRQMTDLGLASVLPPSVLLLLFALTASFALALTRRPLTALVPMCHIVVLIVMLYGVTAVLEAEPRFTTTWRHVGIVDHIARTGSVDPNIDAYFSWPGFFSLGGVLTKGAGLESALSIAAWAPLVFNLLFLAPLVVIFRWATSDERVVWLGVFAFYSLNWVGQDYFAPQAIGFALWLAILAILLHTFTPRGTPLDRPASFGAVFGRVVEAVRRPKDAAGERAALPAQVKVRRAGLVVVVIVIDAAVVAGHQLTPVPILLAVIGLVALARMEVRRLPVVLTVLLAAWISYMTTRYLIGHLDVLVKPVGAVGENVNQGVSSRIAGSADHQLVVRLRVISSAGIWLLAAAGLLRRLRARNVDIAIGVIAASPFVLPVLQPYGGEMLLRVFLFALPAVAFLIAGLAFPSVSHRAGWPTTAAIVLVGCTMLAIFQYTRYGNERLDHFTVGDVAAAEALYEYAPLGSTLVAGGDNVPWRYRAYADYRYDVITTLPAWRAGDPNPRTILGDLRERYADTGAYVLITRSTEIGAALFYGKPGVLEDLRELLRATSYVQHLYGARDGDVFFVPGQS